MSTVDQPRPIRSFVRREGRLTTAQQRALDELWPRYGLDAGGPPLDLDGVFGRSAPRVLEIGFGDGGVLLELARNRPEYDFLGIEVHRPGVGRLLHRLAEAELTNVRVICADAVVLLRERFRDASLDRINIFFPDPWPKKRHHKRRLIQPPVVALLAARLRPDGLLHLATDWPPYAEQMLEGVTASGVFVNLAEGFARGPGDRPPSKFERRGLRLGHPVHDLRFRRRRPGEST